MPVKLAPSNHRKVDAGSFCTEKTSCWSQLLHGKETDLGRNHTCQHVDLGFHSPEPWAIKSDFWSLAFGYGGPSHTPQCVHGVLEPRDSHWPGATCTLLPPSRTPSWTGLPFGGVCAGRVEFRILDLLTHTRRHCFLYKGESISLLGFILIPKDLHAELLQVEGNRNLYGRHASSQVGIYSVIKAFHGLCKVLKLLNFKFNNSGCSLIDTLYVIS